MTVNEQRFLELELATALRRFKRIRSGIPGNSRNHTQMILKDKIREEIRLLTAQYITVRTTYGMGGYFLEAEIPELKDEVQQVLRQKEFWTEVNQALYEEQDMQKLKYLVEDLRSRVEIIITEYKSHAGKDE